uniref:Uncharacterized protein n=1 Tax=Meloidogyne javanica TaxID=6303 RepID=A0A915MTM7_MELJA
MLLLPLEFGQRILQLSIFGWQLAAIKYEKDRAANTLLPNYNSYGRYDIPTYYESYWQSPEERYYTSPPQQYRDSFSPPFDVPRSRSAIDRPFNRHADEFYRETPNRFRRANSSHRYRPTCRNCGREHGRRYNYRYQCCRCYPDISTGMRHRKNSSSSLCSLATHHEITYNLDDNRFDRNLTQSRLRHRPPMPLPPQTHWSDHESDYWSGFVPPMSNSEHNYTNINSKERTQSLAPPILPRRRKRNESAMEGISSQTRPSQKTLEVPQGISIPQVIFLKIYYFIFGTVFLFKKTEF